MHLALGNPTPKLEPLRPHAISFPALRCGLDEADPAVRSELSSGPPGERGAPSSDAFPRCHDSQDDPAI